MRWHPLIETTEREATAILERALALEPRLTEAGIGVVNQAYKRPETIELEIEEQRARLCERVDRIAACADWIKLQRHLDTFTAQTSYSRKCDVEQWFRSRGGPPLSVSNGALIAAALGLGIEGRLHGGGPNMVFKLAEGPVSMQAGQRDRAT